jgi:hypothetical protein
MNRFRTAVVAALVTSFVGLQPLAARAEDGQRRYGYDDPYDRRDDRREEARDRREERRDRREERRDRRDHYDDRWDSRHGNRYGYGYGYDHDRWDPRPYYRRDDRRYRPRRLGYNDRIYRGSDDRYYCRRDDGTTGMIIGGITGGVLGNVIARERSRTLGTIIGAATGAAIGGAIDSGDVVCR